MTGCQFTFGRRELKYVLSNDERQGLERACVVNDGSYGLSAGDDGIHSDSDLYVLGGTIDITQSYEGLEGATVTVAGGDVSITSSATASTHRARPTMARRTSRDPQVTVTGLSTTPERAR